MDNYFSRLEERLTRLENNQLDTLKAVRDRQPISPPVTTAAEPVSPDELCKRLNISKPTAWAWEKKGVIRGYHLGNRRYYIWQEVMAAMQGRGQVA